MPSALSASPSPPPSGRITKFTNCRILKGEELVTQDLWVSSATGKIIQSQEAFYSELCVPDETIDLGGRIISPGLIDVQLNGAFGFDFASIAKDGDPNTYGKNFRQVNKLLVKTGVTSYLPTITSSRPEVYHHALPFLGPSGAHRTPSDGSESLGAHVEGPFISPTKNGIHPLPVLQEPTSDSLDSIAACYGASNLHGNIRLMTAAPELPYMTSLITPLTSPPHNIIFSIGHTESTYEEATSAISAGATMITHLFNAMRPLHHRNPGIFGLLGVSPTSTNKSFPPSPPSSPSLSTTPRIPKRPYFGLIADGIHLHPSTCTIAYNAHPSGLILVTDAMHLLGLPSGRYPYKSSFIHKRGNELMLESENKIAGSSITLIECVNNFVSWTGCTLAQGLKAVTETPARMLGVEARKGGLHGGADADLCVLEEEWEEGVGKRLRVVQVWKFGVRVYDRESEGDGEVGNVLIE